MKVKCSYSLDGCDLLFFYVIILNCAVIQIYFLNVVFLFVHSTHELVV